MFEQAADASYKTSQAFLFWENPAYTKYIFPVSPPLDCPSAGAFPCKGTLLSSSVLSASSQGLCPCWNGTTVSDGTGRGVLFPWEVLLWVLCQVLSVWRRLQDFISSSSNVLCGQKQALSPHGTGSRLRWPRHPPCPFTVHRARYNLNTPGLAVQTSSQPLVS